MLSLNKSLLLRLPTLTFRRTFATEKQLFQQIQSTKNIMKITSSMKMVSAAKLKGDESRLQTARPFNGWSSNLNVTESPLTSDDPSKPVTFNDIPQRTLVVPITSDKGLCGGVNSFISRGTRDMIKRCQEDGKELDVVIIGDKGRSQMTRMVPDSVQFSATEFTTPYTFDVSSLISEEITDAAKGYDAVAIVYNKFVNSATYVQVYKVITPLVATGENETMVEYEFEPSNKPETLNDLSEYLLTSSVYHSLMESAASEQSARMAAMENATKNAGEMVDSLTLKYNRARQARITTELIEIISGASALED